MSISEFFNSRNISQNQNKIFKEQKILLKQLKTAIQPQNKIPQPTFQIAEEQQNLQSTIFVGNVSVGTKHKDLKKKFNQYGQIQKIWFRSIPVENNKMGKKASFILKKFIENAQSMNAYIKFKNKIHAEQACAQNGRLLNSLTLRVSLCQDKGINYTSTIFIGNLPLDIHEQQVREHFKSVGIIENIRIIKNKQTFQGIGVGYVKFSTKEEMLLAIQQYNGSKLKERPLRVKRAIEKKKLEKKMTKIQNKYKNKNFNIKSKKDNMNKNIQRNDLPYKLVTNLKTVKNKKIQKINK